jgi:hypothetical protein
LVEIDANFLQNLLHHLVAFFFHTDIHGIVDGIVHHLLPLLHDVVLSLKLHGDPLQLRQVH